MMQFEDWFLTSQYEHRLASISSNVTSILAALLCLYAFVNTLILRYRYRLQPRCLQPWNQILSHLSIVVLVILLCYRGSWTWGFLLTHGCWRERFQFPSELLVLVVLSLSHLTQHVQVQLGPRLATTAFWFTNAVSLGFSCYVALVDYDVAARLYMVTTCCAFAFALALFVSQGLRLAGTGNLPSGGKTSQARWLVSDQNRRRRRSCHALR